MTRYEDLYHDRKDSTRYAVSSQWQEAPDDLTPGDADFDGYADTAAQALAAAYEIIDANIGRYNHPERWLRVDVFRIDTWLELHEDYGEDEYIASYEEEGDVLHFDTGPLYDETPED